MPDDRRLRDLLERKVREVSRETAEHDGDVSAEQLAALKRLAELVEVHDKVFPATPAPRWRVAAVLAATLVLVSLLLFLRVGETQVELQLVVSEVEFALARPQVVTGIVNLGELGAAGLRGVRFSDPELSTWSAASAGQEQTAVRLAALESATLTLDPLRLPTVVDVRIDADRAPTGCRIALKGAPALLRTTAHGHLQVDLVGSGTRTVQFAMPRSILLESDRGETTLDLVFAKGASSAFAPQLFVDKLALSRIDEFQATEGTTAQAVSTILSGTIYFESLGGEARPLRARELLRFDDARGVIRTLELEQGRIVLAFSGTVRGMRSGWGGKPTSLMPTWLAWLRARHGLSLLWGTTLYLFGLITAILRWWTVRV